MSEAKLKVKWRQAAKEQGFWVRALSPHQIPGLPDIVVADVGASEATRAMRRTRHHWIEAKLARLAAKNKLVFSAPRDATAQQIRWALYCHELGIPAWWLLLDSSGWMLVPSGRLQVGFEDWAKGIRRYGTALTDLHEPEVGRAKLVEDGWSRLRRADQRASQR